MQFIQELFFKRISVSQVKTCYTFLTSWKVNLLFKMKAKNQKNSDNSMVKLSTHFCFRLFMESSLLSPTNGYIFIIQLFQGSVYFWNIFICWKSESAKFNKNWNNRLLHRLCWHNVSSNNVAGMLIRVNW